MASPTAWARAGSLRCPSLGGGWLRRAEPRGSGASGETALQSAKLSEIAENLHRREIDELERAELVAAWVKIVRERRDKGEG